MFRRYRLLVSSLRELVVVIRIHIRQVPVEKLQSLNPVTAVPVQTPLDPVHADATLTVHSAGWLEGGLSFGYEKFINDVGRLSENEGHHPEITFGWGYAKIIITTHAIEGLSENDFILAAKIDQIFNV